MMAQYEKLRAHHSCLKVGPHVQNCETIMCITCSHENNRICLFVIEAVAAGLGRYFGWYMLSSETQTQ